MFDCGDFVFNPAFKTRPLGDRVYLNRSIGELKVGTIGNRELALRRLHSVMQAIPEILIHQVNQGFDFLGFESLPLDTPQQVHRVPGLQ